MHYALTESGVAAKKAAKARLADDEVRTRSILGYPGSQAAVQPYRLSPVVGQLRSQSNRMWLRMVSFQTRGCSMACLPDLPLPSSFTRTHRTSLRTSTFACGMLCEEPGVDFTLGLAMVLMLQLLIV